MMAYSKNFDDDISIISMSQADNSNLNFSHMMENESSAASIYALQIALKDMKLRCDSLEQKYSKSQRCKNILIGEINGMKQSNDKWLKEIDKDETCTQLRQKMSTMSLEIARLYDQVAQLSKDKASLQRELVKVIEGNQELKRKVAEQNEILSDTKSSYFNVEKELFSSNLPSKMLDLNSGQAQNSENWQGSSLNVLKEVTEDTIECRKNSKQLSFDNLTVVQDGNPEEYHSHHKLPNAPCACALAPCAAAVDNEASIEMVISECHDIKEELVLHTESLRNTCAALKAVLNNTPNLSSQGEVVSNVIEDIKTSDKVDSEHNFISNIATYNSEGNRLDVSLQATESVDEPGVHVPPKVHEINPTGDVTPDRDCPICGALYPAVIPFNEFETHVLSHFDNDGDEITRNFEFV